MLAYRLGQEASKVGLDWENTSQVVYKVEEEWQEFKEEIGPNSSHNSGRIEEEMGDLLFTIVQLARHLSISPEKCLDFANKKFIRRMDGVKKLAQQDQKKLEQLSPQEMDRYWEQVKSGSGSK